ncbi:MAG: hypothetical protein Q9220_006483 [cf. Caloplaca sp. 1 TL-2023]
MAQRQPDKQGLANQGEPLGNTTSGGKVNDPTSTLTEPTGAVASDSLAAESSRSNGAFAQNPTSQPLSVSGSSSTFANTDTSSARELAPAPDAAEREAKEAWSEVPDEARGQAGKKYPEGAGDVEFEGSHNADGYVGGSSGGGGGGGRGEEYKPTGMRGGAAPASGGDDNEDSREEEAGDSKAGEAPGYVSSVQSEPAQTGKPKGKNIIEGGFESDDANNASFNSEIGSKDDPGRGAEEQFQTTAVGSAGGKGPRQGEVTKDGQYDVLEGEQSL